MDEQVLKLFAETGPHAQDALNSWVTLQWIKFFADTGLACLFVVAIIVFFIWLTKGE